MDSNSNLHTFEKREIAVSQLRRAIQLYNVQDFICAITLAGAAEEILGRIAEQLTGTTALDGRVRFWSQLAGIVGKPTPERKRVVNSHNRIRNQNKHNDSGDNGTLTADFEFEAYDMILRAITNYVLAYKALPQDRIIKRFHYLESL